MDTVSGQSTEAGAAAQPSILCAGLSKRYGTYCAVDDLHLSVYPGELFGFLGPNGAGKTTTIKMLTGLLRPSAGTATICGHDIQLEPMQAKRVLGYTPDNPFLYEKLTGYEFLDFMADLYTVPLAGRSERILDLLRLFDLTDKGSELIQGYSRGMRQKTALAGALIHDPRVILLDEPTVGLDPKSARQMKDVLRQLCSSGVTVFVSTHILEIAERMCDRFAIINHGHLVAVGNMAELRAQAASDTKSLEDIFLELTGEETDRDLIRGLA